jgi:hypothetical protein
MQAASLIERDGVGRPRAAIALPGASHPLRMHLLGAGMLLIMASAAPAAQICPDRAEFEKDGWQLEPVQRAIDVYLRDHRMRVNWMHEPRPPDAVGRDYYEWLWINEFGAGMKADLARRFCEGAADAPTGQ